MPKKTLRKGDDVTWKSTEGTISGTVEKKVTKTTRVKGHVAKATEAEPQYVVKSKKTAARAVHKAGALRKK